MPQRITATAAALDLLERLRAEHGDLIIHISGGCCDGSSPMCLRAADLPASPHDVELGALAGVPSRDRRRSGPPLAAPRASTSTPPPAPPAASRSRRSRTCTSPPRRPMGRHVDASLLWWAVRDSWGGSSPTTRSRSIAPIPDAHAPPPDSRRPIAGLRHLGGAMPEAVIVDAIRTPIGRAMKGTLRDVRADDLAAIPLRALVERNPDVDFGKTNDIMMGCGFPDHEQGYNIGRNAALLAGHRSPCAGAHGEPLLRILAAGHPDGLPRHQGGRRRSVHRGGRGVRVARCGHDASRDEPAHRRHERHGIQRVHPHGAHGRERGRALQGQPRVPGRVCGALAAARVGGARQRPLRQRDRGRRYPRGPRRRRQRRRSAHGHARRRAASGHDRGDAGQAQAGLQARWHGDRGQRVPAQRRRRSRAGDVRGPGRASSASSPARASSRPRWRRSARRSWASARSWRSGRCSRRPA